MVGAVVKCVDPCAMHRKFCVHPVVQTMYIRLVIVAARDAALVRDNDDEIAVLIRPTNRVDRAFHPDEIRRVVEIMHIDIQCAVAVEKNRLIPHTKNTRPHLGNRSTP